MSQGDIKQFTKKNTDSYYFREESTCRQVLKKRLLLSNTNCQFINIRNNRRPWKRLTNTTTFPI